MISRPAALFDPYAAIATLDQVFNVTEEKKDERASRYEIILRQCRPLLNNPCLQQVLIKLVASKEKTEVARVIAKATKWPVPVNHKARHKQKHMEARLLDGRVGHHTRGVAPISALQPSSQLLKHFPLSPLSVLVMRKFDHMKKPQH